MKQLTVVSGKGGTGKTTIVVAFASLAKDTVFADCDAPDLQLILDPEIIEKEEYIGTKIARRKSECSKCGRCVEVCRFGAIDGEARIDEIICDGCGACSFVCPEDAIEIEEIKTGTVYSSRTRYGTMVHAELEIGEEASGMLVSQVRQKAKELAGERSLIILDGSPGIGCPVIASITGVDAVLAVAEPTITGIYDLERVLSVAEHFGVEAYVCVNKYDINERNAERIEEFCRERNVSMIGRLPYDEAATKAMVEGKTVIEYSDSKLSQNLRVVWEEIGSQLGIGCR